MRVYPKCGYIDPPQWLHCKFSYHIDSCQFAEFETLLPSLASQLKSGGDIVEDKDYYYRLNKTKTHVMRKAKIDWTDKQPFGAEKYEKINHKTPGRQWKKVKCRPEWSFRKCNPSQTKLVVDGGKETKP